MFSNDFITQDFSSEKYFNIQFEYRVIVPTHTKFQSFRYNIQHHTLNNVSMDKIGQQDTFLSWFSQINVPEDAFILLTEEILECVYDMVYDDKYKNLMFLTIQVEFVVTRATEDEDNPSFEEDEEVVLVEIEEEEEDNGLVHDDVARVIEGETDEDDFEVDYGLEEEMMAEEEYNWFTPAAKLCVEELDTVNVEEATQCTICFDDFNVGVRLPCSHMFHANCIEDWLTIGCSCPLCRFQLPTSNTSE
jgi:hypothetical protein